jgi:hypothetical protein
VKAIPKSHFRASPAIPHIGALIAYTVTAILRDDHPGAIKKSYATTFFVSSTNGECQRAWNWFFIACRKDRAAIRIPTPKLIAIFAS